MDNSVLDAEPAGDDSSSAFKKKDFSDSDFGYVAWHFVNVLGLEPKKVREITLDDLFDTVDVRIRETESFRGFVFFNYLYDICPDFYERLVAARESLGFADGFRRDYRPSARTQGYLDAHELFRKDNSPFYRYPGDDRDRFVAAKIRKLVGFPAQGIFDVYGDHPENEFSIQIDFNTSRWHFSDDDRQTMPWAQVVPTGVEIGQGPKVLLRIGFADRSWTRFTSLAGDDYRVVANPAVTGSLFMLKSRVDPDDICRFVSASFFDRDGAEWPYGRSSQDVYGLGMVAISLFADERLSLMVALAFVLWLCRLNYERLTQSKFFYDTMGRAKAGKMDWGEEEDGLPDGMIGLLGKYKPKNN